MSETKPPPPRYRIVERQGRLIVTDTWAEGRPAQAKTPMTPMTGAATSPRPGAPGSTSRRTNDGGLIDTLGAALVLGICARSTDSAGSPILTTTNYYDVSGPREIVLAPASAKRLGRWLLAFVAAAMAVMVLILATQWGFVAAFVLVGMIASSANTTARPVITRWLDRLEQAG